MGFLEFFIFVLTLLRGCKSIDDSLELNDDVFGLIAFKSDIIDSSSHLSSWNQDDNSPCAWKFITCNPATGRVTELSLAGLSLSGKIGRGLEKLQNLQALSLAHNNLTGNLNPQLSLLTNLERLNLSGNTLSSGIPPSLINSGRIKFLDLSENSLSGPVPEEFFLSCSSLRLLSLSRNNLQGPIPSSLSQCTILNHLNLSHNRFSGNPGFATSLWLLPRIRTLDLSHNVLSGQIPNGALGLPYLKELFLQGNHFSGALPSDIGLCSHLKKLDLSNNLFTEELPVSFQGLSSLTYLNLANNILTGEFPLWIGKLNGLEYLDISGNGLTGILPTSIGGLGSLTYVSLSGNSLSGSIPTSLIYSSNLSVVRLRGSSRLFETIQSMDLSANRLTGDIPAEMGLFSKLRYLNLSWNNFETRMPLQLGYFQNLTMLDLRNGAFHGSIPGDICNSGSLEIMQLDGNSLTGSIPDDIGNCSSLYLLSMSHNDLRGPIPRSMSLLKKLKILKLDSNQLSGEIPQELGELENLLAVNISYNRLQGRLPAGGIFPSLQQSSLEGNLGICSPFLKGPCKMNVPKPLVLDPYAYGNQMGNHQGGGAESSKDSKHHRFLSISAIIAILASVLISIGVLVISLLNISARRRLKFVNTAIESCSSSSRSGRSLSMGKLVWFDSKIAPDWVVNPESLLNKAAEIGGGVFGTVYKASLGEDGRDLAIKNLVVSNMVQYPQDFDREVRVLGKARHPNLVSVKGYYWTPQLQLLVTDYAPNGSLQAKLHERSPSTRPLSWPKRFKILLGTAKGLAHLHHSFRPPIVHYNIKPSNILLDDDLNPKISDFGLTRLVAKLDKQAVGNRFQSALGYVAPELACQSLRVNEKCDIYGFGVLILELLTGRRPIEYGDDNVVILNEQVKIMLEEGNVLECVDQSMGEYPEDEVLPVLKLALVCTSQIPSSRPSMAEVIQILHVIKTPIPHRMEAY
ncbi:probably inactive leucine-rich repeat receptor-like protein kinase At3g28040 [Cynara cardunculus var. scolymus]|uniref:probably inactive leucine-rich repeat receptor-like protein kinase At3g28040 n=1 Tax=Cynara cardunculus var. scolymus TaxID=59895 RepID=UPI000D62DDA5|nr:probably inactive leucine-rich repeat receptor-like protein kinase At3g28040 [Cynara cardunculus var. scolymus]